MFCCIKSIYSGKPYGLQLKKLLISGVSSFKSGGVEDFRNFINAVIDEKAFNKIESYIEDAKKDNDTEIIVRRKI